MKEKVLKRKGIRRVLSLMLALVMCLSLMPVTAFASGETIITEVSAVNVPFSTVAGYTPSYVEKGDVEVGDSEKYEALATWYEPSADKYVNDAELENGKTYWLWVMFYAKGDYTFADNCTATINGVTAKTNWHSDTEYDFYLEFTAGPCTHASMTPIAQKNPTCKDTGKLAYFQCNNCQKYFEDSTGETEIADIYSWGKIPVTEEHTAPDEWTNDINYHRGFCKVCGRSVVEDHDLSSNVTSEVDATFDEDGKKVITTTCSKCDYSHSKTEIIPAGKYIRESKATMTPASITKENCANDLVFESSEPLKYTVELWRVIDLTDASLNIGLSYPKDENFVAGHEYAIEMTFHAVEPYVYDTDYDTYWSTFWINGSETDMSAAMLTSGTTSRRIQLVAEDHTHVGIKVDQVDATCTSYGVKTYYECSCGKYFTDSECTQEITDLDAWKVGDGKIEKRNHDFTKQPYQVDEDGKHYQKCKDCGAESTHEAHTGGTATCKVKAKCTVCGKEYGELAAHKYDTKWSTDATNHWKACTVCGTKKDSAAHADANKDGKCDTCSYSMHTHAGTKVAQVDATCTSYGVKAYYKCSCGKYYTDSTCTKEITDLAAWKNGDGRIAKKDHAGGTATCKEKAKCSTCGKEYGDLAAHTYDTKWSSDGTNHWHACTVCGAKKDSAAHTLKTTTTKATFTANGKKETKCSVCGKLTKTITIYAAKTVKLSKTTYTYDGKAKKPTVTIKDSKGKAIATTNYSVKYDDGRKNVGKYNVKITFKGDYKGSKTLSFTINPKATTLKSVTPASKAFTAKWTKQTTQVDGYELEYALDKNFTSSAKKVAVTKNTTTSKKISSLKAKKTYYVRVRTYKKVGTKKYYSDWSKTLNVKTK